MNKPTNNNEDINKTIETNNEIVKAAGKKPLFESVEELDKLMESEDTIVF